ncbi:chaplin [Streptomyces sp. NPDC018000]|uniref:chaplin n=1 Tax=Streptomyces sp. NPDC018000 TaxID=3365028 RepID=UPI00378C85CA
MKYTKVAAIAAGTLMAMGAAAPAFADAGADGSATSSPGVASGNAAVLPVHVPAQVCGNTGSVVGGLNAAFGTVCTNT